MKILLVLLLLVSCGKVVDVQVPKKIDVGVGPDFAGAIKLCDERYGVKTLESEACFKDYRQYTQIKLSADPGSVLNYCQAKYTTQTEIDQCELDLNNLLGNK